MSDKIQIRTGTTADAATANDTLLNDVAGAEFAITDDRVAGVGDVRGWLGDPDDMSYTDQVAVDPRGVWATPSDLDAFSGGVSGEPSSVDGEVVLWEGTGGDDLKRATGTGYAKLTSGVLSASAAIPESDVTNLTTDLAAKLAIANNLSDLADPTTARWNIRVPSQSRVIVVSVTNETLSGTTTIDGIALVANNRVLLTGQSTGSQNGIWTVQAGAWTRPADFPTGGVIQACMVLVAGGTLNARSVWAMTHTGNLTIDSGSQTWEIVNQYATMTLHNKTMSSSASGTTQSPGDNSTKLATTAYADAAVAGKTITLTGDVTGTGTGTFAATVANDAVTYAKMQNVSATDKLLGRSTAGAGDVEEIALTAAGRALIDDATTANQRTTLGLVIGTDVLAPSGSGASLTGIYVPGGTDVAITDGGTGVSTLPTGILKGAGTGAITAVTAPAGAVVGTSDTQALTNKDLTGAGNTFPTLNQNTSGTAANVSGTPALPNGTTATTQTAGDNSTKLATTAYVATAVGGGGGSGTVTSVSVVTANGLAGTVANATTTPAITLTTSITGVLKGNGTAISAAALGTDYYGPTGTDVPITDGGTGVSTLPTGLLVGAGTSAITAVTAPAGAVLGTTDTQTITNKRKQPRVNAQTSTATLTPEIDTYDVFRLTAQAATLTIANHSTSTPADGEYIEISILDNGTARGISFGTNYVARGGLALPTSTAISKLMTLGFKWYGHLSKWVLLANASEV